MASWPQVVLTMGKWYQANIHTYWNATTKPYSSHCDEKMPRCYNSPYGPCWDDCTGFCSTCLLVFGVFKKGRYDGTRNGKPGQRYGSADFASRTSACGKSLMKGGFLCLRFSWSIVLPYDIISVYEAGGQHHSEVYYGKINGTDYSYGWGSVHDGRNGNHGMPHPTSKQRYQLIWRYTGVGNDMPLDPYNNTQQFMNDAYGGGLYGQEQEANAYPVHDEYVTITAQYGNIFESATANAISVASYMNDSSWLNPSTFGNEHVRIYSTNDSSIVLDELSLPLYHKNDNFANKNILGERERDNTGRIDRSLYETTDSSTNIPVDSSTNKKTNA